MDAHAGAVGTAWDEGTGTMHYVIDCPRCGGRIQHEVKPRWGDPGFLEEFGEEIRLVAFDLLLLHVEDAHDDAHQ
ncbi:MAG: hypothetical protein HYU25_02195 [Candidatus Rokubacteria bacterium]|nr:hypothetical protein [Candidatus Rokubacteria bacterium]